jgi:hypothetical protein
MDLALMVDFFSLSSDRFRDIGCFGPAASRTTNSSSLPSTGLKSLYPLLNLVASFLGIYSSQCGLGDPISQISGPVHV